ncbi:hypothetical protein [Nostoc sp. C110]|uniref:hypothetical protein n=1 Tax=Nostoc sp. C110 TaxID=3349876 RepID=UPI00370D81B6
MLVYVKKITKLIAKLTMVQFSQRSALIGRIEKEHTEDSPINSTSITNIPVFINLRALTFPVLVGIVKSTWEGIKLLPLPSDWSQSTLVPFLLCITFGILICISNISEEKKPGIFSWISGIIMSIISSIVVFTSVIGISSDITTK